MTEIKGTVMHLIIFSSIFITADDTQQSSAPEKARHEGKNSSSKWFIRSIRDHSSIDKLVL